LSEIWLLNFLREMMRNAYSWIILYRCALQHNGWTSQIVQDRWTINYMHHNMRYDLSWASKNYAGITQEWNRVDSLILNKWLWSFWEACSLITTLTHTTRWSAGACNKFSASASHAGRTQHAERFGRF
jgi:hypothetical protein